ncbi:MAG: hypothetical protein PWP16_1049 [Eubacteriaceae bacterium]|nr:hypothetical protein [Eubacteriaceae bacterium]MDN5307686.1 hypothetical protein [Eubacteriaceae bacterium]
MENEGRFNNTISQIKAWKHWKITLIILASICALIFVIFSFLLIIFLLTGNGSVDMVYENDYAYDESYDSSSAAVSSESQSQSISFEDYTSSVIYAGCIRLYTDDYQKTSDQIIEYANTSGGFLESSQASYIDQEQGIENNSGSLTIRIPADQFEQAMIELEDFGVLASSNTSSVNITREYQDVKTQIDNLKVFESRLLEYSGSAANLSDLLAIETELNRIRTEMDSLQSLINNWNTEIAYSRININIEERALSTTMLESPFSGLLIKIQSAFLGSINLLLRLISGLIILLVWLLPFAALIALIVFAIRKIKRKRGQKKKS